MTFGTSSVKIFVVRVWSNRIVLVLRPPINRTTAVSDNTRQNVRNHSQSHARDDDNRIRPDVKANS